ncbi:MAG: hypothetical protein JJU28_16520 [Cyclobacteriaceae bacterium]|nr:hypothetical protein [Cyclobacteriaceae bacterium]
MRKPFVFMLLLATMACFAFTPSNQVLPTNLRLTVLNNIGNPVQGAMVKLYANEDDYDEDTNAVAAAVSDKKGIVNFKGLETKKYFVRATKGKLSNADTAFETDQLVSGRINRINLIIQ